MRLPTNVDFDSPSGPSRALEYHRPDGGQNKDDSSVRKKKKKRKRRKIVASIYYIVPDGRRKRLLRERFWIDLVMLRDGPRLHHSGKLGLLDEDQPLLHVFLAPLHSAPSPAPLLAPRPLLPALRLRALPRRGLQVSTLRPWRRPPRG